MLPQLALLCVFCVLKLDSVVYTASILPPEPSPCSFYSLLLHAVWGLCVQGLRFCFCFFNGSPSYPHANVSEDRNHSLASGPSLHCHRSAFFLSLATCEVLYVLVLSMQTLEPLSSPYLGSFLGSPHPPMPHCAAGYHQGLRGDGGKSGIASDILHPLSPAHRMLSSITSVQSLKAHPPNQFPCLPIHSEHHLLP